jgi:uncharacterized protein (DUF608 family)
MNFKDLWNSQADHQNQWDSLGEDEKLEFVAAHEREECAKLCDESAKAGSNVAYILAKAIRARGKA